jgi:hypothetical protein
VVVGELCGSGLAVWQWASCVTVGKLYTVGELYIAGEPYVAGELCGSGQAVWRWASCVGCLGSLASDPVLAQMSNWPTAPHTACRHETSDH